MSDEEPEAKRIRLDNESGPQYSTFALRQMVSESHNLLVVLFFTFIETLLWFAGKNGSCRRQRVGKT